MAARNYEAIMEHVFEFEGGYVDHPRDPGGSTNMGITIGTLRDYQGRPVSKADVKALTKAEAREIYRRRYWNPVHGDALPSGVDLCVMDSAVNSGTGRGAKWLQRAVGVEADGAIGPKTLAAVGSVPAATIINRMCDDRMDFLRGLKTWPTFGKGWTRRVKAVRQRALVMAESKPVAAPTPRPADPVAIPKETGLPWAVVAIGVAVVAAAAAAIIIGV